MSLMLLMVTNQMPNTSNYVPLMGWYHPSNELPPNWSLSLPRYYMGIIFVIVFGTMLATGVLLIHSRKAYLRPLPRPLLRVFFLIE